MVRYVGAHASEPINLSRRRFLGWGATVLTAAALPGATLLLTENAAAAEVSPYAMTSWQGLLRQSVQVSVAGGPSMALQVVKVTDTAVATRTRMAGDSFVVSLKAPGPLAPDIYTVTAPGLGSLSLFMEGAAEWPRP